MKKKESILPLIKSANKLNNIRNKIMTGAKIVAIISVSACFIYLIKGFLKDIRGAGIFILVIGISTIINKLNK